MFAVLTTQGKAQQIRVKETVGGYVVSFTFTDRTGPFFDAKDLTIEMENGGENITSEVFGFESVEASLENIAVAFRWCLESEI
jgi:hypothetical protein